MTAETLHYNVTTRLDDRQIGFQHLADPFIHSTTVIGTWDLIKALVLRRKAVVTVILSADRETIAAVTNLPEPLPIRLGQVTFTPTEESTTDD